MGSPLWIDGSTIRAWVSSVLETITNVELSQIKFPASQDASSDANTLDDYEEGTWTPAIGGTTSESGQTYTTQLGRYTKIGKLVLAEFVIVLSAKGTITGSVQLEGLPFTVGNSINGGGQIGQWQSMTVATINITMLPIQGTTVAFVYTMPATTATSIGMVQGDLSDTSTLQGCLMYQASA